MTLAEAVAALDRLPPVEGTWWGDAIIACREAARATLVAEPAGPAETKAKQDKREGMCATCLHLDGTLCRHPEGYCVVKTDAGKMRPRWERSNQDA